MSNITMMPGGNERLERTGHFQMRTTTVTGRTVTDCLLQAKEELGADAIIVSRKTYKKGALFGKFGGREIVEMTFGTYLPPAHPLVSPPLRFGNGAKGVEREIDRIEAKNDRIEELETQIASLTESVQSLAEKPRTRRPAGPAFIPAALEAEPAESGQQVLARLVAQVTPKAEAARLRRKDKEAAGPVVQAVEAGYPGLMQQLMDADIAAPLARQLIAEMPAGLAAADSVTFLRTILSQRLRIANGFEATPTLGKMRLLAFVGTTGVGKTTTIAKLTARFALLERRKVGVITLDTHRVGAAEQLQKYGEILRVPVKVAHDKLALIQHLEAFAAEGMEMVLLDTAGRSPNEMIPLGETAHLFDGVGAVQKYLTIPAMLGQRDMDNIVTKFQQIFTPDAVILTKLDEASDHTCFGRLLTLQAKFGLPLAYVTTGQRVPDDIVLPDAHAIASRILAAPLM